ncbi:hypothetical protein DY000_02060798 [Brassica cretica]|uniref:Uncharacterized protein n=1 Tax=Brassica cretica TaxID=69181 RepID=A0ABQ7B0V2_BRACR|nr:hypothetical protein DY000_02060798 [Brassica cretica]
MTLSPLFPLSREPSPLKWTRSYLERDLRLLHLANVTPIEEDLATSTSIASHLLLSILPSKSLRRAATYFSDDGSPDRDSIIFPP